MMLPWSRRICGQCLKRCYGIETRMFHKPPTLDERYILQHNIDEIRSNIIQRKGVGDIDKVRNLHMKYLKSRSETDREEYYNEAAMIPNRTHPDAPRGDDPKELYSSDITDLYNFNHKEFIKLMKRMGLLKQNDLITAPNIFGTRSYFMIGDLARLERALVMWCLDELKKTGWNYISVPDILPETLVNACGFPTTGKRHQIYKLRSEPKPSGDDCLSGTAEMSLAALHSGSEMDIDEPIRLCSFSSCYRAEDARNRVDKNFYRLHQFTKVEMFVISPADHSERMFNEIVNFQKNIIQQLGLRYRLLDMPSIELGASAYRKHDIEVWMPSKKHWGEVTSASNCTDYQSRRLHIEDGNGGYLHTLNGTACAVPRILIALIEEGLAASNRGFVMIPECLRPYIGKSRLESTSLFKQTKHIKSTKFTEDYWLGIDEQFSEQLQLDRDTLVTGL